MLSRTPGVPLHHRRATATLAASARVATGGGTAREAEMELWIVAVLIVLFVAGYLFWSIRRAGD
jgi:hypothetical protein